MTLTTDAASHPFSWPAEALTQVPYQVFLDPTIYEREQERLFRGPIWSYVGLEAEIPQPQDFKATFVGDTPVIINRDKDGSLHAFVNRCAHRGALLCRELRGNRPRHTCVYHQWTYDLKGNLVGVPFKNGIGDAAGLPSDFDQSKHTLHKLRIASYRGLIFVTFSQQVESLEEYLGSAMCASIDTVFNRPVNVLGHARQFANANWKLYAENVRDPYHASLLHLFHMTFGMYRSSQRGGVKLDPRGRHCATQSIRRNDAEEVAAYKGAEIRSYQAKYSLNDPSLLQGRPEFPGLSIQTIFPNLVIQQIQNTLAVRHILPRGPQHFELIFTFFGYTDDDADMQAIRRKQANLVGPAGLISMEDGHAAEIVQQAIIRDKDKTSLVAMGRPAVGDEESLVTETAIRGFWRYYRELMGYQVPTDVAREDEVWTHARSVSQ